MRSFDIYLPGTVEDATGLLPTETGVEARGERMLLAGGQDLLGEMKDHLEEPSALVDLRRIPGLDRLAEGSGGGLECGALVTVAALEGSPLVRERFAMIAEGAAAVASPQIRSVGTLGGNLCQRPRCWYYRNEHTVCLKKGGDECFSFAGMNRYNAILGGGPSWIVHPSDLAPPLVAAGAEVALRGPDGERRLPLEDFYTLPADGDPTRENVLAPNEVLTEVRVPATCDSRAGWRSTYVKVRERGQFDFALSAVALALRMEGDEIAEARLVLGGVAPVPWRCLSTEELLVGRPIDDATCRAAGEDALARAEPLAQNEYKIPMTKGAITKALRALRDA